MESYGKKYNESISSQPVPLRTRQVQAARLSTSHHLQRYGGTEKPVPAGLSL